MFCAFFKKMCTFVLSAPVKASTVSYPGSVATDLTPGAVVLVENVVPATVAYNHTPGCWLLHMNLLLFTGYISSKPSQWRNYATYRSGWSRCRGGSKDLAVGIAFALNTSGTLNTQVCSQNITSVKYIEVIMTS